MISLWGNEKGDIYLIPHICLVCQVFYEYFLLPPTAHRIAPDLKTPDYQASCRHQPYQQAVSDRNGPLWFE